MARSFNGSTDQIDCGSGVPTTGLDTAITVSAWIYMTSLSPAYSGVYVRGSTTSGYHAIYVKSTGKIAYYVVGNSIFNGLDPGSGTISTGTWHHVALTTSGANFTGYLDGVNDAFTAGLGIPQGTTYVGNVIIGSDPGVGSRNLGGRIADVAVWNAALSPTEISALASGVRPYRIRRANLLQYLPLEGTASPEPDVIGGNNGTLTGTTGVANPFNYTTPKYGSRSFNGSSDKINCGTSATLSPTPAMTCSAWIYPTSFPNAYNAISGMNQDATHQVAMFIKSTGKLALYYSDSANVIRSYDGSGANTLVANTLYHIAYTVQNTSAAGTGYVNGVFDQNIGIGAGGINSISANYFIGTNDGSSQFFAGRIADVATWNVALSTAEIAKLAVGFRPHMVRPSGLIAYWPLEGAASPEPDMVAGNNGTLTGTSAGASPTGYKDIVGA